MRGSQKWLAFLGCRSHMTTKGNTATPEMTGSVHAEPEQYAETQGRVSLTSSVLYLFMSKFNDPLQSNHCECSNECVLHTDTRREKTCADVLICKCVCNLDPDTDRCSGLLSCHSPSCWGTWYLYSPPSLLLKEATGSLFPTCAGTTAEAAVIMIGLHAVFG